MDSLIHIQGPPTTKVTTSLQLAPLFLIHAVSGFGLPYLSLGSLSPPSNNPSANGIPGRPVYALSSPTYQSKSYTSGLSFAEIANEYVERIRSVRAHGPYVLGGWSMGGMLALKMAEILQSHGEEIHWVILIDSINPEGCPPFKNNEERDALVRSIYAVYAPRLGLVGWDEVEDVADESLMQSREQANTDDEEDDDEVDVSQYLPRMRAHISNSLDIMARAGQGPFLDQEIESPITLIKCTKLAQIPSSVSAERAEAIAFRHKDIGCGWEIKNLECIELATEHDRCFDPENLPKLTNILRNVLEKVK